MPSFGDFLRTQFLLKIPKPTSLFSSKTVLITGANSGFGKETAKHVIDLESAASIKSFVERAKTLPRLDVVINNAGIQTAAATFSLAYDTERSLGLNVIGTFLLAFQLIPKLKEPAKMYQTTPSITTVTSAMYDAVQYPQNFGEDIFAWYKGSRTWRR